LHQLAPHCCRTLLRHESSARRVRIELLCQRGNPLRCEVRPQAAVCVLSNALASHMEEKNLQQLFRKK